MVIDVLSLHDVAMVDVANISFDGGTEPEDASSVLKMLVEALVREPSDELVRDAAAAFGESTIFRAIVVHTGDRRRNRAYVNIARRWASRSSDPVCIAETAGAIVVSLVEGPLSAADLVADLIAHRNPGASQVKIGLGRAGEGIQGLCCSIREALWTTRVGRFSHLQRVLVRRIGSRGLSVFGGLLPGQEHDAGDRRVTGPRCLPSHRSGGEGHKLPLYRSNYFDRTFFVAFVPVDTGGLLIARDDQQVLAKKRIPPGDF